MGRKKKTSTSITGELDLNSFIKVANFIFDEAFQINRYLDLLDEMKDCAKEYRNEMRYSALFYNYTYLALVSAITMDLAKIFDRDSSTISISRIMSFLSNYNPCPDQGQVNQTQAFSDAGGLRASRMHRFSAEEISFLRQESNDLAQRIMDQISQFERIASEYGFHYSDEDYAVLIGPFDLTIKDHVTLFGIKKKHLGQAITNLNNQRSKIYAHNDYDSCFNFERIQKDFPLAEEDIRKLTNYASEVSQIAIALSTGVVKSQKPIYTSSLKSTLELTRIGILYQGKYLLDQQNGTVPPHPNDAIGESEWRIVHCDT